jgi:hypothetical protein
VNEKPSDDPIPTIRTDSGVKVTPEQLAAIKSLPLFGRNFHPVAPAPSRCDWLLDRYPEEFVRSLMEGGRCDLRRFWGRDNHFSVEVMRAVGAVVAAGNAVLEVE